DRRELRSVPPADLDLAFDAYVPPGHVINQMPILLERIGVEPRQVHVIVDVVRLRARTLRSLEERRLPIPRPEEQGALAFVVRDVIPSGELGRERASFI